MAIVGSDFLPSRASSFVRYLDLVGALADFYVADVDEAPEAQHDLAAATAACAAQYESEPLMVAAKQHEQAARRAEQTARPAEAASLYRQAAQKIQELQNSLHGQDDASLVQLVRSYYTQATQLAAVAVAAAPTGGGGGGGGDVAGGGNVQLAPRLSLGQLSRAELENRCQISEARAQSLEEQLVALRAELNAFRAVATPAVVGPAASKSAAKSGAVPVPEPEPKPAPESQQAWQLQSAPAPAPASVARFFANHAAIADMTAKIERRRANYNYIRMMPGVDPSQCEDLHAQIERMEQELIRLQTAGASIRSASATC